MILLMNNTVYNHIIFMLSFFISYAESSCLIEYYPDRDIHDLQELRIKSGDGPLIYTYNSYGPEFRYPIADRDRNCVFYSSDDTTRPDSRLHLACPGYFLEVHGNEFHKILNTTYLMESTGSSQFSIPGHGPLNFYYGTFIKCTELPIYKMRISHTNDDVVHFSIGFKLNAMDFLTNYRIIKGDGFYLFGHVTVVSVIDKRPKFTGSQEYKEGLIYKKKLLNFTDIYMIEQQKRKFQQLLQDKKLVDKYFSNNNYLVKGHLISTDDLFYKPQQISTFYYENTVPVWRSISEGNWKLVGDIVRKLADQSVTDMEVFAVPINNLRINNNRSLYLGNLENSLNSPYSVNVPQILVKVVFSSTNIKRGLVFHTANDPYISVQDMEVIMLNSKKGLCKRLLECSDGYPEFLVPSKGLTYCCALEDSKVRNLVQEYIL